MSAVISPCGKYRYRLDRSLDISEGPTYAFFGVNPSTADRFTDDTTVRKWTGFVQRWGGRRFIVGNAFAYRATNVRDLAKVEDPYGPAIGEHITDILAAADILVPCWGRIDKVPLQHRGAFDSLRAALAASGKPVRIFGLTKDRAPKHPLMLGYDTPLVPWVED
jgi:hypothetical protein